MEARGQWRGREALLGLMALITAITLLDWAIGLEEWMMVPGLVTVAWEGLQNGVYDRLVLTTLSTSLTAGFLHADVGHLVGNMLFLWLFGAALSDRIGSWLVWPVFLFSVIGGSLGQILLDPSDLVPSLGASGGLMGVEGCYFGLALSRSLPRAEVWPLAGPVTAERMAVFAAIGIALDFTGLLGGAQGIAYGAHIGGFVTGILLSFVPFKIRA